MGPETKPEGVQGILQATKLRTIMKAPVITVSEDDDFHLVQDKMAVHDIRHIPVVNESDQVVGLISERHLYKIHSPRRLENGTWFYDKEGLDTFILKNVMVPDPFTLGPENTLEDALKAMVQFKFGCIAVVDNKKRSMGIITRIDILKFFLSHA
jgi:acetoin utilization protein AcuB